MPATYDQIDLVQYLINPPGYAAGKGTQLYIFPNSFAHFSLQDIIIPESSNEEDDTEAKKAI